jgi:hypothetical protein
MFFPAGIPILAVVAAIIWNTVKESRRSNARKSTK